MPHPFINAELALQLMDTAMDRRYGVPLQRGPKLRLPPPRRAPDPTDPGAVGRWVGASTRPTAIDLFCGAGGLSLGLHNAGFRVLLGADIDPLAVETHVSNLGGLGYTGDLTDSSDLLHFLESMTIKTVDLVAGGVPCQPFSRAGQSKIRSLVAARARPEHDRRADLWESFIHAVRYLRPRAVLLENVPDLAQWDDGAVLIDFCESLRELGYRTEARILHAYEYGVPQHRSRLFVIGTRAEERRRIVWPAKRASQPTLWDAISDLPKIPAGHRHEQMVYAQPHTALQRRLRRGTKTADRHIVWDHVTRALRPDDEEAFSWLPEGGTYLDIPERLRRYRSDIFTDKYKRLARHDLSRTITAHVAKDGYWYIHPTQERTLSIRETARLQTFPDCFRFAGEPSHRLRQIGNAVPPLLSEALGRGVMRTLTARPSPSPKFSDSQSFRELLLDWHARAHRRFPWRSGATPWGVLLAEMCLHRTRADQVAAVYTRLVTIAPSPLVAVEHESEVRSLLQSLGLRWRVDKIIEMAEVLVRDFDGVVPSTRRELIALPGVGDYVASSVLGFGFGHKAVLIDTNTERIVSRVSGFGPRVKRWQMRLSLYELAGFKGATADFNYALLDLGALICRSSSARCDECPVRAHCRTGQRLR
ncbi:MAG: DNA (cytosine-5-)-methyltransferase [Candidatus Dormiibacterota bacterium]